MVEERVTTVPAIDISIFPYRGDKGPCPECPGRDSKEMWPFVKPSSAAFRRRLWTLYFYNMTVFRQNIGKGGKKRGWCVVGAWPKHDFFFLSP
jgi:hypothetical protein